MPIFWGGPGRSGMSAPVAGLAAAGGWHPCCRATFAFPMIAAGRNTSPRHAAPNGGFRPAPRNGNDPARRSGRLALAGRAAALRLGRGGLRLLPACAPRFHQVDGVARTLRRFLPFDRFALGLALDQLLQSDLIVVLEPARV